MSPNIEPILTIRDGAAARSIGNRPIVSSMGAMRLTSIIRRREAAPSLASGPETTIPALLTRRSNLLAAPTSAIRLRLAASSVMSAGQTVPSSGEARSARVSSSASALRPTSSTRAPADDQLARQRSADPGAGARDQRHLALKLQGDAPPTAPASERRRRTADKSPGPPERRSRGVPACRSDRAGLRTARYGPRPACRAR